MRWPAPPVFMSVVLLSSAPGAVRADDQPAASPPTSALRPPGGVELGVRLGYGVAGGSLLRGYGLADRVSGQVPFIVDAGYRFSPYVFAGVYGQYGTGITAGCAHSSCAAQDYRFGVDAIVHVRPREDLDPWFGLGVGYELLHTSMLAQGTWPGDGYTLVNPVRQGGPMVDVVTGASDTGHSASTLQRGPEMNLQLGVDWRLGAHAWVGPFVMASIGQYVHNWHDIDGAAQGASIANTTWHEWFFIGLRATTDVLGPH